MPRPRLCLCKDIKFEPDATYFKPRGVPMADLEIVELSAEEMEALRLKNSLGFDQTRCAKEMKISQSTFQRLLSLAYQKVTEALVSGKAIEIKRHN